MNWSNFKAFPLQALGIHSLQSNMKYIVEGYPAVNNTNQILKMTKRRVQCREDRSIFFFFFFFPNTYRLSDRRKLTTGPGGPWGPSPPFRPEGPWREKKKRERKKHRLNRVKLLINPRSRALQFNAFWHIGGTNAGGATFNQPESGQIVAIDTFVLCPGRQNRRRDIIRHL